MNSTLQTSIERLYAAFDSVPKPVKIDGCRCCIDDREVWTMLSTPLRELTTSQLSSYVSNFSTTVGSVTDFRYYLPRILELTVTGAWWGESLGPNLVEAGWLAWPAAERDVIRAPLEILLFTAIEEQDTQGIDRRLSDLSELGLDLAPYLARLESNPEATLAFYRRQANPATGIELRDSLWGNAVAGAIQVIDWFYSPSVSKLILDSEGADLHALKKPAS